MVKNHYIEILNLDMFQIVGIIFNPKYNINFKGIVKKMTDYSIDPEVLSILEKFSLPKNLALER